MARDLPAGRARGVRSSRPVSPNKAAVAPLLSTSERIRIIWTVAVAALLMLAASVAADASELHAETLKAWNEYMQDENARVAKNSRPGAFLWSDQSPDRICRLRQGEFLIAPFGENPKIVPHGLIHHWIGAMFVPKAELGDVLNVVRDYEQYKNYYAPSVIASRLLRHAGTDDAFSMRMLNRALVAKLALDAEFQSSYARLDANRWYSVGYSTRIRELADYGQATQHELPANTGHGFVWRLYMVSRFEQRDGGVYVELEAVALSRDVPSGTGWLVNPAVRRVSRSSMLASLRETQEAVLAHRELASRVAQKDGGMGASSGVIDKSLAATVDAGYLGGSSFGKTTTGNGAR
jgi:hypothetical protein